VPQREVEYLTKDELAKFLDAMPVHTRSGLRHRALAEILCATGMRISEAISLNRDHIDWGAHEARIIGKGNKPRRVYFTEQSLHWLSRYLDFRDNEHPAVFIVLREDAAKRLTPQGIWKVFRQYAKRTGLTKRVYPHMLRHTLATTLLANGCPIGHIRAILGHEHLVTTCKYYLGTIAQAEVKSAHQKYLFFTNQEGQANHEGGEKSDESSTGP
jgi:site-specific recombinase XerD